ncbi:response regulator, partial [Thermodesulfobacteriota bacterium]
ACLEDAGFNVDTAVDGVDALEKIDACEPDLMTLDMVMPKLSGIMVIRKLRKNEKWSKLPVIVITAHARDELGSEQIVGFDAMTSGLRPQITMEKPISPDNLIKTIGEILDVEVNTNGVKDDHLAGERRSIMRLLNETDSDTLDKIRGILNK